MRRVALGPPRRGTGESKARAVVIAALAICSAGRGPQVPLQEPLSFPAKSAGRLHYLYQRGRRDEWSECPLVEQRLERFPPEPFCYLAARIIRGAVVRKETSARPLEASSTHTHMSIALLPGVWNA